MPSAANIDRPPQAARRTAEETRERILATAHELFHFQGIRATGVDTLAARAEVAPPTLYRLFASKDELVAAYVERCSERYRAVLGAVTSPEAGTPRQRILAVFDAFDEEIRSGACRGCPFLMALAEYSDPQSPAHVKAVGHKAWLRGLFHDLARELGRVEPVRDPTGLAEQLALVAEGMYGSAQALGATGPAAHGRVCAQALIDAGLGEPVPRPRPAEGKP